MNTYLKNLALGAALLFINNFFYVMIQLDFGSTAEAEAKFWFNVNLLPSKPMLGNVIYKKVVGLPNPLPVCSDITSLEMKRYENLISRL